MTELELLKAELAREQEANASIIEEQVELARVKAEISLLKDGTIRNREVIKRNTAKLEQVSKVCEEIVNSQPIYSRTNRENRKWNPSATYGYGNQVALVSGLLTGILYSAREHKQQMLAYTNLDIDLVEETVEAFGSPSYYSKNYNEIVPEKPANLEVLTKNLELVSTLLGVTVDLSKVTEAHTKELFATARLRAQSNQTKAEEERAKTEEAKKQATGLINIEG